MRTGTWCSVCRQPVRLRGPGMAPEFRRAEHAETGDERGPGGPDGWHVAIPTTEDPELRAEADAIEADFPMLTVSVRFGFFRADWKASFVPFGATPRHYEASAGGELRGRLRAVLGGVLEGVIPESELVR